MDDGAFDRLARDLAIQLNRRTALHRLSIFASLSLILNGGRFARAENTATTEKARGCDGRSCKKGRTCCQRQCVDLETDDVNCGKCGNPCTPGSLCSNGRCTKPLTQGCGVDATGFARAFCDGQCVAIGSDVKNCGECGKACAANEICCLGTCVENVTTRLACGTCPTGCPTGQDCCSGTCCAVNYICCDGQCVDPTSDARYCGGCDARPCSPGALCCSDARGDSRCTNVRSDNDNCGGCGRKVAPGKTCCGGKSVNLLTDGDNCGVCFNKLEQDHYCVDGDDINTMTDRNNCGAVGQTCCDGKRCLPTTDRLCCAGRCSDDRLTQCCRISVPGQPDALLLVNPKTNPQHCGGCGKQCPAGQACCGGVCVDLLSNSQNCGTCGHDCGSGKYCTKGMCCKTNEDACPDNPTGKTLVCTDITSDPKNCGYCGRRSPDANGCYDSQFCLTKGQICLQINDIDPSAPPDYYNNNCCPCLKGDGIHTSKFQVCWKGESDGIFTKGCMGCSGE